MGVTYSVYEAKARFSEVIRQVREGNTVTVSYRGEPVAEIRPTPKPEHETLADRLDALERKGVLVASGKRWRPVASEDRRPGVVERFLAERHE